MDYEVRPIRQEEWPLLADFLYEALFIPEGFEGEIPRAAIYEDPKCYAAIDGFGSLPDDRAVVATAGGEVVGACWVRTTDAYGHIDSATPTFSISLYSHYRNHGIGTALMQRLLADLRESGYARASLSVSRDNPAVRLYERLGFVVVGGDADAGEYLMVSDLQS